MDHVETIKSPQTAAWIAVAALQALRMRGGRASPLITLSLLPICQSGSLLTYCNRTTAVVSVTAIYRYQGVCMAKVVGSSCEG